MPPYFLSHFRSRYRKILILFDNDGKHSGDSYPEKKIFVPRLVAGDKDVTDFCTNHSKPDTAEMLRVITNV